MEILSKIKKKGGDKGNGQYLLHLLTEEFVHISMTKISLFLFIFNMYSQYLTIFCLNSNDINYSKNYSQVYCINRQEKNNISTSFRSNEA